MEPSPDIQLKKYKLENNKIYLFNKDIGSSLIFNKQMIILNSKKKKLIF